MDNFEKKKLNDPENCKFYFHCWYTNWSLPTILYINTKLNWLNIIRFLLYLLFNFTFTVVLLN